MLILNNKIYLLVEETAINVTMLSILQFEQGQKHPKELSKSALIEHLKHVSHCLHLTPKIIKGIFCIETQANFR